MTTSQGPPQPSIDKAVLGAQLRAGLWQAVWEASQLLSGDEIRDFVNGVIAEIEADAP